MNITPSWALIGAQSIETMLLCNYSGPIVEALRDKINRGVFSRDEEVGIDVEDLDSQMSLRSMNSVSGIHSHYGLVMRKG